MEPLELRIGGQTITGNLTLYGGSIRTAMSKPETTLVIEPLGISLNILLHGSNNPGSVGTVVATYPFTAVQVSGEASGSVMSVTGGTSP